MAHRGDGLRTELIFLFSFGVWAEGGKSENLGTNSSKQWFLGTQELDSWKPGCLLSSVKLQLFQAPPATSQATTVVLGSSAAWSYSAGVRTCLQCAKENAERKNSQDSHLSN